jgi:DNA-binding Lrp family transcriptional regulator
MKLSGDGLAEAFLLVNTDVGAEMAVMNALENISEVMEASTVYGVYDIIVRLEAETMEEIKIAIQKKMRAIDMVRSTMTMIVI